MQWIDKQRLYEAIMNLLRHELSVQSFCSWFSLAYAQKIDYEQLTAIEEEQFRTLARIADFHGSENDIKAHPSVYRSDAEVRVEAERTWQALCPQGVQPGMSPSSRTELTQYIQRKYGTFGCSALAWSGLDDNSDAVHFTVAEFYSPAWDSRIIDMTFGYDDYFAWLQDTTRDIAWARTVADDISQCLDGQRFRLRVRYSALHSDETGFEDFIEKVQDADGLWHVNKVMLTIDNWEDGHIDIDVAPRHQ